MKPVAKITPIRLFALTCLFVTSASISHLSIASGGYDSDYTFNSKPKPIDHTYEAGKSIFKGRKDIYKPHTFCILDANSNQVKKVKRSTVRPFKKQSANSFADSLYSCKETSKSARDILSQNDITFLVYYLNKRFSLRLTN